MAEKRLLAVEPGYRESKDSWVAGLRDLQKRGFKGSTAAAGAMAFKLLGDAQRTWKKMRGHGELILLVSGTVAYKDGVVLREENCQGIPA